MKRLTGILIFLAIFTMTNAQSTTVTLKTTKGDIKFMLYDDTPLHKENFIELAEKGFYDGLLFHRVIPEFMIQTGDPNSRDAEKGAMLGSGNPGYTIPAEFKPNRIHKRGAVAAARRGDNVNPQKESSGSQFYIVTGRKYTPAQLQMLVRGGHRQAFSPEHERLYLEVGGTPHLDFNYTVFGEVVSGMDVVELISQASKDQRNRPTKDIEIKEVIISTK